MSRLTKQAEEYLKALIGELEIPKTRYEQAERSYKALGEWFHRPESSISDYDPEVFVQGSFRLGTVIKPNSSNEQYDIDCTCVLSGLSKSDLSQAQLKALLGTEIKAYRIAKNMTKEVQSKQRCWRLEYSDEAQFHMDIVPSLPNGQDQRVLLEARSLDASFADTAIAITDDQTRNFGDITDDWPRSNPKGYAEWFKARMGQAFTRRREQVLAEMRAKNAAASIEDVPTYRVRTPLQSAIMILKRHRDMMFSENSTDAPISIIISTLAAHAYNDEETNGSALIAILDRMESAIKYDGEKIIIPNPTDATENFADKWERHPERAEAFQFWLKQARSDFSSTMILTEKRRIARVLSDRMGNELTSKAFEKSDAERPALLRSATTASSTGAPSVAFGEGPRNPKKPDGFA
ncbi:nucleotidyltransferase domain-containing protein [Thalassospira marina]|uniref:Cyclic GMP-AMP synthase n=1 Tax=Thalassospira marina TaxID=2048283 RepID=A0A2N3KYN4_9PROT|nr:nucleotidyltransferase [Thalassospira marina]PKR55607.1 nucleotidyltransferase [Thalassospira marina]